MDRRQLLKTLGCVSATSCLPAFKLSAKQNDKSLLNVKKAFANALNKNPSLIGFEGSEKDYAPYAMKIEGSIPKDLNGYFYRNGPAKHQRENGRYRHLFEGDGMIQEFAFHQGKLHHRGRFLQTPKFIQEEQQNKFLYSGPETKFSDALPVSSSDAVNVANTNVLPVGGDLWALWEAGSASKVDAKSLEFEEYVDLGKGSKYGKSLRGLPFSAHPKVAPDGDIWNFGLGPGGHVVIYHLSPHGQVKQVKMLNARYQGRMLHDFLITKDYVLLILPSLEPQQADGYFGRVGFNSDIPLRVLVVNKSDLSVKQEYELDAAFAFHFGNAWQHNDGSIHFDASLYPNVDVLHKLGRFMHGDVSHAEVNGQAVLFTLYPNGTSKMNNTQIISEFPRVCSHLTGLRNKQVYFLSSKANSLWSNQLIALNTDNGAHQSFDYGDDFLVEEHIPVCPKGIEGTGYVIGSALHVPTRRTCINVFKAGSINQGPIARGWLPYHLPLGFHGNFKPA